MREVKRESLAFVTVCVADFSKMTRLRLFGRDNWEIPNYSVVETLIYDVVAMTNPKELSPWEKLFVVEKLARGAHRGYLADIHLLCGCFQEARVHYSNPEHPRKLGDICWCEGEFAAAQTHYEKSSGAAQTYRISPDDDRLIKLAFYQGRWSQVVERFTSGSFSPGFFPGKVCISRSETAAQPYLDMLAAALGHLEAQPSDALLHVLDHAFGIKKQQWKRLIANPLCCHPKTIEKLRQRCMPRVGNSQSCSLSEAVVRGDTPRSRQVAAYIQQADEAIGRAQATLGEYAERGEEKSLEEFFSLVTGSGIDSVSRTMLFAALGHDSFTGRSDVPAERLVRLLSYHPIMHKRHFGRLLELRFLHRVPVTGEDVLTGIFQSFGLISSVMEPKKKDDFGLDRLASCREWAKIRLQEWLDHDASSFANNVGAIWREGKAKPAPHPFYPGTMHRPESPRNMAEWNNFVGEALKWLRTRWKREIGATTWISENQFYQLLRRLLKGMEVQQHARPTWLRAQHFDIYVPEVGIAVEYMGEQHYKPLEFFGGEAAFNLVAQRDQRKAELCRSHGVELLHVRFDEDVGARAREIASRVVARLPSKTPPPV